MVILNILKIGANVNVFQNANNFLLIMNNLFELFLGIVPTIFMALRHVGHVKLDTLTFLYFLCSFFLAKYRAFRLR